MIAALVAASLLLADVPIDSCPADDEQLYMNLGKSKAVLVSVVVRAPHYV